MFESVSEVLVPERVTHYRISKDNSFLSYSEVLQHWQADSDFRDHFAKTLRDSPFTGYRWETPSLTDVTIDRPFEFVLVNTPGFSRRQADTLTYAEHFSQDTSDAGVVAFQNLSGDATLVVPVPTDADTDYGHLAAFVRNAPESQVHALWKVLSSQIQQRLSSVPLWVSTAGGGVAWLHVRIDGRPKYYHHRPFHAA